MEGRVSVSIQVWRKTKPLSYTGQSGLDRNPLLGQGLNGLGQSHLMLRVVKG